MTENYKREALALHAGYDPDPTTNSRAVPIYPTTSYVFKDSEHAANLFGLAEFGNIYSRLMNPTCEVLEKRIAALDGGIYALSFSSGQAAINAAILTIAHSGQNIISSTSLYGGTWTLFTQTFEKLGIEVRFFDPSEPEKINDLVDENSRCVYFESIGNPKNDVPDFEKISKISHDNGLPVICDNTVMTPFLLRPFEHGVDIVIHSTTKFIGGHGAHIGGVIVDSGNFKWADNPEKWPEFCAPSPSYHGAVLEEALRPLGNLVYLVHIRTHWLRDTGAAMSPFAAWITIQGLETLHLRMERHCENAQAIAEFLEANSKVERVTYPGLPSHPQYDIAKDQMDGFSGMISMELKGGIPAGISLMNGLELCSLAESLGAVETMIIHPATMTHADVPKDERLARGLTDGLVRLSVGIEDKEDIIADLNQALDKI